MPPIRAAAVPARIRASRATWTSRVRREAAARRLVGRAALFVLFATLSVESRALQYVRCRDSRKASLSAGGPLLEARFPSPLRRRFRAAPTAGPPPSSSGSYLFASVH